MMVRWKFVATRTVLGVLIVLNLRYVYAQMLGDWSQPGDWQLWMDAGSRMAAGSSPYVGTVSSISDFRWSPLAALLAVPVSCIGVAGWYLLHVAVLGLLRDWRLILLTALSWPFWVDLRTGNLLTFAFVLAVVALRGNRLATAMYLGLFLLVPRPVMAPVALWLLWRRSEARIPFLLAGLAELGISAAMGELRPWLGALLGSPGDVANPINYAPSRFIGLAWSLVSLPLAALAFFRGRLGLASLTASPYVFPYYLLFAFLELPFVREWYCEAGDTLVPLKPLAESRGKPSIESVDKREMAGDG